MSYHANKRSPYDIDIEKRHTVANLVGWGEYSSKKLPWCAICRGKRYLLKGDNYYCSNCGYQTPVNTVVAETEKTLNLKHRPNTAKNPLIVSQPKKKRRGSSLPDAQGLTDENYEDLAAAGIYRCGERYKLKNAEYKMQ
jgi:predicted RNA-binding Zn-ribbon protein involved in translation (DUF1610 family)